MLYMYIYMIYTYICMYVCMPTDCMYMCKNICIHIEMHTYMYINRHIPKVYTMIIHIANVYTYTSMHVWYMFLRSRTHIIAQQDAHHCAAGRTYRLHLSAHQISHCLRVCKYVILYLFAGINLYHSICFMSMAEFAHAFIQDSVTVTVSMTQQSNEL